MKKPRGRNLNEILADRRARRQERLRAIFFGVFVLALGTVLFLYWQDRRNRPEMEPHRVVVVPFDNRTGDAAFDTLGLVAADWITRNLSYYAPGHQLVPTTSTLAFTRSAQLNRFDLLTRAERLAHGTGSQIVVWGSFYHSGDSLRFSVEATDLKTSRMIGSIPQIATPVSDPMRGADRLRSAVIGAILKTESLARPIPRIVPKRAAYQRFVAGLDDYMRGSYRSAASNFAISSRTDTTSHLPHQTWLIEALFQDRQFARADSAAAVLKGFNVTRVDEALAMRTLAQLRGDRFEVYSWAYQFAAQNDADDFATYRLAMAALALNRVREARLIFSGMKPNFGFLHGRPEYYLHYAAAHHLAGNHRAELNVVRTGLMNRHRSLDVRLANCRARAALGRAPEAWSAAQAITAPDTDATGASVTVGAALEDCASELEAHGMNDVAKRVTALAGSWYARAALPAAPARDSVYERAYVLFENARAYANRGERGPALNALGDAVYNGLPIYEPGRMILHAEPAFRTLRNTRGFLRINQPRG